MVDRRRIPDRGFTLIELLMVVVIVSILTFVAYPALETFAGRNRDVNAATHLTRTYNKARDQARRRNRAMVVQLGGFHAAQPQGLMTLREGLTNSCIDLADGIADNSTIVLRVPFGAEDVGEGPNIDRAAVEDDVGLRGWRLSDAADAVKAVDLNLCISPNGSVSTISGVGGAVVPIDRLRVIVQAFSRDAGGWEIIGPERQVEISFAGGARMGVGL